MSYSVEVRSRGDEVLASIVLSEHAGRLLPDYEDQNYPVLRYVDEYGDTYFNSLQVRAMQAELVKIRAAAGARAKDLDELVAMAELALQEPHRFLIFIGD